MDRIPRQCVQYVKNTYFAQKTKELIVNDKMQQRNSIQTKQHINTQNTVLPTLRIALKEQVFWNNIITLGLTAGLIKSGGVGWPAMIRNHSRGTPGTFSTVPCSPRALPGFRICTKNTRFWISEKTFDTKYVCPFPAKTMQDFLQNMCLLPTWFWIF